MLAAVGERGEALASCVVALVFTRIGTEDGRGKERDWDREDEWV